MLLVEVLNNTIPYEIDDDDPSSITITAKLSSDKHYRMSIIAENDSDDKVMYDVSFSIDYKFSVETNVDKKSQKDAIEALALTVDIMKWFIEKYNPSALHFSADADHKKIYRAIINRFITQFDIVELPGNISDFFMLEDAYSTPIYKEKYDDYIRCSIGTESTAPVEICNIEDGKMWLSVRAVQYLYNNHPDILKQFGADMCEYIGDCDITINTCNVSNEQLVEWFGERAVAYLPFVTEPVIVKSSVKYFESTYDAQDGNGDVTLIASKPSNQTLPNVWLIDINQTENDEATKVLLTHFLSENRPNIAVVKHDVVDNITEHEIDDEPLHDKYYFGNTFDINGTEYLNIRSIDEDFELHTGNDTVYLFHPFFGVEVKYEDGLLIVDSLSEHLTEVGLDVLVREFKYDIDNFVDAVYEIVGDNTITEIKSDLPHDVIKNFFDGLSFE